MCDSQTGMGMENIFLFYSDSDVRRRVKKLDLFRIDGPQSAFKMRTLQNSSWKAHTTISVNEIVANHYLSHTFLKLKGKSKKYKRLLVVFLLSYYDQARDFQSLLIKFQIIRLD